eukprot:m.171604 g.171604  ORF g.171604 m.171604 type:complete len:517 (-) comp15350_c0_seq34:1068-2618(-)
MSSQEEGKCKALNLGEQPAPISFRPFSDSSYFQNLIHALPNNDMQGQGVRMCYPHILAAVTNENTSSSTNQNGSFDSAPTLNADMQADNRTSRPAATSKHSDKPANEVQPTESPRKRMRFSDTEVTWMRISYEKSEFPNAEEISRLANAMSTDPKRVQVWFRNQRRKKRVLSLTEGQSTTESVQSNETVSQNSLKQTENLDSEERQWKKSRVGDTCTEPGKAEIKKGRKQTFKGWLRERKRKWKVHLKCLRCLRNQDQNSDATYQSYQSKFRAATERRRKAMQARSPKKSKQTKGNEKMKEKNPKKMKVSKELVQQEAEEGQETKGKRRKQTFKGWLRERKRKWKLHLKCLRCLRVKNETNDMTYQSYQTKFGEAAERRRKKQSNPKGKAAAPEATNKPTKQKARKKKKLLIGSTAWLKSRKRKWRALINEFKLQAWQEELALRVIKRKSDLLEELNNFSLAELRDIEKSLKEEQRNLKSLYRSKDKVKKMIFRVSVFINGCRSLQNLSIIVFQKT